MAPQIGAGANGDISRTVAPHAVIESSAEAGTARVMPIPSLESFDMMAGESTPLVNSDGHRAPIAKSVSAETMALVTQRTPVAAIVPSSPHADAHANPWRQEAMAPGSANDVPLQRSADALSHLDRASGVARSAVSLAVDTDQVESPYASISRQARSFPHAAHVATALMASPDMEPRIGARSAEPGTSRASPGQPESVAMPWGPPVWDGLPAISASRGAPREAVAMPLRHPASASVTRGAEPGGAMTTLPVDRIAEQFGVAPAGLTTTAGQSATQPAAAALASTGPLQANKASGGASLADEARFSAQVEEVAEAAWRIIMARLAIERERRGYTSWMS